MNSSRPYLLRAIHQWLSDNKLTPYIMVDAMYQGTLVPQQYVKDGKIVLNISYQAVKSLEMTNADVQFVARFDGVVQTLYIPMMAIEAIYSFENGKGMVFSEHDLGGDDTDGGDNGTLPDNNGDGSAKKKKGPPNLKVIK